jgi:hypothetical protein
MSFELPFTPPLTKQPQPWWNIAVQELGTRAIPGAKNNNPAWWST